MRFFILILGLFPILALAELPPSAYEAMQAKATDYLKISILRVDAEQGDVPTKQNIHVVATVSEVVRSAGNNVKSGDIINIVYTVTQHPKGWVGPGEVPVPEDHSDTIAYLNRQENGDFEPAAGRMTFSNF